jgi:two-component system sensor histidine kinase KdpD
VGDGFVGEAALKREVIVNNGGMLVTGIDEVAGTGIQVAIPLITVPGQLVGVLTVSCRQPKTFAEDELKLLRTIAHHITLAIDKAQLYMRVSQHTVELEKLVAARTVQLTQAVEELWNTLKEAQQANRLKSLLLSTVSHELRTPLATIKGNTSLLLEHYDKLQPELIAEHLRDIEEETDKLTELISNLLQMSRIEAGTLHIQLERIDVVEIIRSAAAAASVRHTSHPVRLESAVASCGVKGDPQRIEQVVANLIDNAAKYSPEGEPIIVQVQPGENEVVIAVIDLGPGIAPEHQERIFEHFYQIHEARDSGRHGIGLGLAICRGLVEAQGGRIWVESAVGKGSTFCFTLPVV